ncbi:uncharacterized protein LOC127831985 [Dreissena polymorpha]|uniref:uncharacterized protein LOC127831985 n=1 Tax=Dreissena polymorpha TaxID=45954 RepID=UPI002263C2ED|nr:uncharacterized protein LOC127831985 [Dreissena polymorpha]
MIMRRRKRRRMLLMMMLSQDHEDTTRDHYILGQHLLLTSNVPVVEENNPLTFTCVLPSNGANTGWIVNGVRTETALLDDGRCIQPSAPPQGFIYTCVSSTVFTLTILQVKREQNGDQWTCDSWINGGTLYSNNVTLKVQDIVTTSTTTSTTQTTTASSTTTAAIDQQSILQIGPIVGGAVAGIILVVVLVGLVYESVKDCHQLLCRNPVTLQTSTIQAHKML